MKKVCITIANKDYTITLEDDFADFFQLDLGQFLHDNNFVDTKDLLTAYVQKCYESYEQKKELDELNRKIDKKMQL